MSDHLLEDGSGRRDSDLSLGDDRKENEMWPRSFQKNWRCIVLLLACFDTCSTCAFSLGLTNVTLPQMARKDLPVLTSVAQVRALSPEEAARGFPIKLQAVVTFYNEKKFNNLFIHDSSGGIHVDTGKLKATILEPGQLVDVEGVSDPGAFVPNISATRLEVAGKSQLPEPRQVSFEHIITGQEACQWIEVNGIVRCVREDSRRERLEIEMVTGGSRLVAHVSDFGRSTNYSERLVDARVRIRGVCTTLFNRRRQLSNVRLLVPGMAEVFVDEPAPLEPFAMPICTVSSLMRFAPEGSYGRRARVQGVVIFQQPDHSLFIRDKTQGLFIETAQNTVVQPGDRVDVIGFPARGEWTPILQDAIFRKTGDTLSVPPVRVTAEQALMGTNNADLVQLEAMILDRVPRPTEEILVLQSSNLIFNAQLERVAGKESLALFSKGSRIRLTGICRVDVAWNRWPEQISPQSFHILLRSPADLMILQNPPWWTLSRLFWVLSIMIVLLVVGIVWVGTLRRQVREQTEAISRKIHREAILQERHRMAREIHDTLVQSFAAISLQLEAIRGKIPSQSGMFAKSLELAHRIARESLIDARRSIWALHSETIPEANLAALLAASLKTITDGTGIENSIQVKGEVLSLPAEIENNLFYIGREAVINAVKHAAPKNITLELCREDHLLSLLVLDDGSGFDASKASTDSSINYNGFGMISMRERAEQIRAELTIQSQHGKGTAVIVKVPLNGT
ncbi:MAG: histidine kinase [Pedosphaera sp.]|nr:histidine kinase [Pedosphaera sp.]